MSGDCRRYTRSRYDRHSPNMLSLLMFVVFGATQTYNGLAFTPPVISDLTPDQCRTFTDLQNNNDNPYFHYMNFDSTNSSRIYIGALDFVYRLNADDIRIGSVRSDNLTAVNDYQTLLSGALFTCMNQGTTNPRYQCGNHNRAVFRSNQALYVCSTGASSPQEFYLDYETLRFVSLGHSVSDLVGVFSCPSAPDTQYSVLYVAEGHGTPLNLSAIYSAIDSNYDPAIYRSPLQRNSTSPVELNFLRTMQVSNSRSAAGLTYVASFEIDQYIYFFYREIAAEVESCGTTRYPRVARVCKNDFGGTVLSNRFITFAKAQLSCTVNSGSDIPVYFNELYDVQYDPTRRIFYVLFMVSQNASWGSAVCTFSYATIADKFDNGQFFVQQSVNSPWIVAPNPPVSRPSLCQANDTRTLAPSVQSFTLAPFVMYGAINPTTNTPLYYDNDVGYSHLTVDIVTGFESNFTVFCLYSDKQPEQIVRVVQWTLSGATYSRIFSILKPFSQNTSPLWEMTLHKSSGKSWLYVVKDTAVFQISMDICSQYTLCTDCVSDPYCGWNASSHTCLPFTTGLIQNVVSPSTLTACNGNCKISTSSSQFCIPGMALHMDCKSYCAPEQGIVWQFPNGSNVPVWPSHYNYIMSQNGGLVILNLTSDLTGTFKCVSNNTVLAEHTIKTSSCQYSENLQYTITQEYSKWCQAFAQYSEDYQNWLCLKNCTLTSSCRACLYCNRT